MMSYNYEVIANTTTLGTMFFASTIFITLVITRYATLAKLIRDSRTEIEKGGLKFKNPEEFLFHLSHYEKRLRLLKATLYLSLWGGVELCLSFLFVLVNYNFIALVFFALHVIFILLSLMILVYELAVSFEALAEHIDILKTWKDKFKLE